MGKFLNKRGKEEKTQAGWEKLKRREEVTLERVGSDKSKKKGENGETKNVHRERKERARRED